MPPANGIPPGPPKTFMNINRADMDIQVAKSTYYSAVDKTNQQGLRCTARKELLFSEVELEALDVLARLHKQRLSIYLKNLIYSSLSRTPIIPTEHAEAVKRISTSIRGIANNINQVVRWVHAQRSISPNSVHKLYSKVNELESLVTVSLLNIDALSTVKHAIERDPEFLEELQEFINCQKNTSCS